MDPVENSENSLLDSLLQENRLLKMKVSSLENSVDYLKEDNEKLVEQIDNIKKSSNNERGELKILISKKDLELIHLRESFDKLKEDLENEKLQNEMFSERKTVVENGNDGLLLLQLNECREEIDNLKSKIDTYKTTETEIVLMKQQIEQFKHDKNLLRVEFEETKNLLEMKTEKLQEITISLEELKEERALLQSELATLKSAPSDSDSRGNSLFGEVDDRRQAMVTKFKILYNKYMALKKNFLRKNRDYDLLKAELNALRTEVINFNKNEPKADNRLIAAQKERIKFLEQQVAQLEKRPEDPQFVKVTDSNYSWAVIFIEKARKEAAEKLSELCRYSLNIFSVEEALHKKTSEVLRLTDEIVKLRAENIKLKIDLETNKDGNNDRSNIMNNYEKEDKENMPEKEVSGKKVHFTENNK